MSIALCFIEIGSELRAQSGPPARKTWFRDKRVKVLCMYEGTKEVTSLKWLYLRKYFEFQKTLLGRYSQISKL